MAQEIDPQGTVNFKKLLLSEVVQPEALTNLLVRKGIIAEEELVDEGGRGNTGLAEAA